MQSLFIELILPQFHSLNRDTRAGTQFLPVIQESKSPENPRTLGLEENSDLLIASF